MPMHRYHPNPDFQDGPDNPDAIFFDFCEECNRQAEQPVYYLDVLKMRKLWNRMVAVGEGLDMYKSDTEVKACKALWPTYLFLQRFTRIDPDSPFDLA